jgi:hypothetical protein
VARAGEPHPGARGRAALALRGVRVEADPGELRSVGRDCSARRRPWRNRASSGWTPSARPAG